MPAIEHVKTLFAYHFDTTGRLMDLAENLSESDYHENPGYGRGSIHDLLFHILNADRGWRVGIETGVRPPSLEADNHADLPSLRERLVQERAAWEAMLAGLTDEELDVVVDVSAGSGRQLSEPRWIMLHHVLFHGMQHHAEIAWLLTDKGQSPGDIDFFYYVWNR